ncbi:LysR family transcriptional regulator [Actinomycetospora termitidis]|uniref:LysR family transcriptional regulator n=1 Tax=Actinomycetospora termitidis TaxID=3053470 RepID=A0ABT7MHU4_9PSEU|nr:LysR family transcriptional regulator [Actinomycetospora sp. Odt1-22]MDL5159764.1 LysR family transcriptional regulator [Actinomycetospora sp. Odt1-22]
METDVTLDLRHLRVFLVLAQELHFSRAAERLHISQSALSQQVRGLERQLGTPLFERTSRVTVLTPAGRVLLDAAPRVLREADKTVDLVAEAAAGAAGRLMIGSVGTALASIAPPLLRTMRARYPDLHLELAQYDTAAQLLAIADRTLDVGLVRAVEESRQIQVEHLTAEPLLVALPDDHPLAAAEHVHPRDLADQPFVLWPRPLGAAFFDTITGYCREHGFSPHIVAEGPDIETQLSLVAAGVGVSLQPSFYANLRPVGVTFRSLAVPAPEVALQVAWRRGNTAPAVRHFVDAALSWRDARDVGGTTSTGHGLSGLDPRSTRAACSPRMADI